MEFLLLGPIAVRDAGQAIPLGGPKQRSVLAILLLNANEPVSRDRLIDLVWGESPPETVQRTLDSYVSRLRSVVGAERVERGAGGYVFKVDAGERDLDRFEDRLAEARATPDPNAVIEKIDEALSLWRGSPLADLAFERFAGPEIAHLEERRLHALEDRIDAQLATGAGGDLVAEVERLVHANPLRERLLAQFMTALYRAGRHADALSVLRTARRSLAEQLGLAPGPELLELERRILRHDPALAPPRTIVGGSRRRRSLAIAMATIAAAALAGGIVLDTRGGAPEALRGASNRLFVIGQGATRSIGLGQTPGAMVADAGSLWVTDADGGEIWRIDPLRGGVVDRIPVPGLGSLTAGAGSVWVSATLGGTVSRIDPSTDRITQTLSLGGANAASLAFGRGRLWIADSNDNALLELDVSTGTVRRTFPLDVTPTLLAVAFGGIWVASYDSGIVEELDLRTGALLATLHVGNGPVAFGTGAGALWVVNSLDATVSRIDARTASVAAAIPVGSGPTAVQASGTSIWVTNRYSGTLSRIDPTRNSVVETVHAGGQPVALERLAGRLWVASGSADTGGRGGTLVIDTSSAFSTVDPEFQNFAEPFQFGHLAYDGLVSFQSTPGPDGLRLVPDLATALPSPSDGGATYSFRLRPGIRYSDGKPVRASDFRRAITRAIRGGSPGAGYFRELVGGVACTPTRCDLARGVVTNDGTGSIVFHLTAPDQDFLYKLSVFGYSAPVPKGIPIRDATFAPIPGTGPYRIAHATPTAIRFERNPYFKEWSHAAQPEGNPDAINWRVVGSLAQEVQDVERGRADWIFSILPPWELRRLRVRFPAQVHDNQSLIVDFIPLNTTRPPFNDLQARQALAFAIDRRKIVQMYGGPSVATPICQPLLPGLAGYRRYCPYTAHPQANGLWSAPDLARARQLVAASGTRGDRIDVWATSETLGVPPTVPEYIAGVLRSLGYRARLRYATLSSLTDAKRRSIQMSVDGDWLPDYPLPSAYLPQFFGCRGGYSHGYVCDPKLDREMQQASALQLEAPARAAALWARIDRKLTDRAYWIPTVNVHPPELVSRRLRNYEFSPVWDFIADQARLR